MNFKGLSAYYFGYGASRKEVNMSQKKCRVQCWCIELASLWQFRTELKVTVRGGFRKQDLTNWELGRPYQALVQRGVPDLHSVQVFFRPDFTGGKCNLLPRILPCICWIVLTAFQIFQLYQNIINTNFKGQLFQTCAVFLTPKRFIRDLILIN